MIAVVVLSRARSLATAIRASFSWDERGAPRVYRVGPDGGVQSGGVVPLPAGPVTAELFVDRVVQQIRAGSGDSPVNLCFTGDRALNARWNSALWAHSMIREIWVPPFPDGSGSAIGAAAVHLCRPHGCGGWTGMWSRDRS